MNRQRQQTARSGISFLVADGVASLVILQYAWNCFRDPSPRFSADDTDVHRAHQPNQPAWSRGWVGGVVGAFVGGGGDGPEGFVGPAPSCGGDRVHIRGSRHDGHQLRDRLRRRTRSPRRSAGAGGNSDRTAAGLVNEAR